MSCRVHQLCAETLGSGVAEMRWDAGQQYPLHSPRVHNLQLICCLSLRGFGWDKSQSICRFYQFFCHIVGHIATATTSTNADAPLEMWNWSLIGNIQQLFRDRERGDLFKYTDCHMRLALKAAYRVIPWITWRHGERRPLLGQEQQSWTCRGQLSIIK